MTGWVRVVGLGAGKNEWLTPEANRVLHEATDIVGYFPYVNAVAATVTAKRHASDNGVEVDRAAQALQMAAEGGRVAVVSGGDAGVFGMASALFEAVEKGEATWRDLDIEVIAGISAMLAASARIGAPLGHDFCVMSLSDYLKPWPVIENRLRKASEGDFVLAIYNPASKTRKEQLESALELLTSIRGKDTIVMLAHSIGRADEQVVITTLGECNPADVTMKTLLIIGSSMTRRIEREGKDAFVYTPRYYKETL